MLAFIIIVVVLVLVVIASGIRVVRPTHRGLVERLGKYNRYSDSGFHVIIPVIERMFKVDIREVLVEAQPQLSSPMTTSTPRSTRRSTSRSRPTR